MAKVSTQYSTVHQGVCTLRLSCYTACWGVIFLASSIPFLCGWEEKKLSPCGAHTIEAPDGRVPAAATTIAISSSSGRSLFFFFGVCFGVVLLEGGKGKKGLTSAPASRDAEWWCNPSGSWKASSVPTVSPWKFLEFFLLLLIFASLTSLLHLLLRLLFLFVSFPPNINNRECLAFPNPNTLEYFFPPPPPPLFLPLFLLLLPCSGSEAVVVVCHDDALGRDGALARSTWKEEDSLTHRQICHAHRCRHPPERTRRRKWWAKLKVEEGLSFCLILLSPSL